MTDFKQWEGFEGRIWKEEVNTRDFIQKNYKPYDGDESFLAGPTEATDKLWGALQALQKEERAKGGVLDMETEVVSGLTAYGPGYIDPALKDLEQIVGLQTDKPLKRAFMPYGGIKMAEQACTTYGYTPSEKLHEIFTQYTRTHNQAVFDAYTPEMRKARHSHIVTGLPDTYGRGRIVGDYRRVALYGIDFLIREKQNDFANCGDGTMLDDVIRQREEISLQINALKGMKAMAATYGYDITATNSYTVQPGDTLSKIAAIHQLSLADLYRANNLTGTSVIKVGQQLVIPQHHATQPAGTTTVTAPHAPAPRTGTTASSYTVQAGDTLSSIARRLGVSMQSLMQANHMTGDQASHLRIGQTLHIPTKR